MPIERFTIPSDGLDARNQHGLYYGDALEMLASACDFPMLEECRENNLDYLSENVEQVCKKYDFEAAMLEMLNDSPGPVAAMEACGEHPDDFGTVLAEYSDNEQPLQLGAFIALKYPAMFKRMRMQWASRQRDIVTDCLGDYTDRPGLWPDLAEQLDKAVAWLDESLLDEYLHGDRSDVGLEGKAARTYCLESVDYDWKTGAIEIAYDVDSEELREKFGLDDELEGCESPEARADLVAAWQWPAVIQGAIIRDARYELEKKRQRREAQKAEREAHAARRKERDEREERERIAKLQGMVKKRVK